MGKMADRRRKRKKNKKTISKLLESLKNITPRMLLPPIGSAFKSKKDYNRKDNKKIIKKELKDV